MAESPHLTPADQLRCVTNTRDSLAEGRNDILLLVSDIHLAKLELGLRPTPAPSPPISPAKPAISFSSTPTKSRFAKLASALRSRGRFGKRDPEQTYSELEQPRLISSIRRGSDESDATLVDRSSPSFLLSILAPLVGALQGYVIALSTLAYDKQLVELLSNATGRLIALIDDLQHHCEGKSGQHDDEMRCLLLDALLKKVESEQSKLQIPSLPSILPPAPSGAPGPLVLQSRNPFILHANSLSATATATPTRPRSGAKPIVPPTNTAIGAGNFTSFAAMGQSSWRMNVHRLGSFQASMLFSPSPVAVRRTIP